MPYTTRKRINKQVTGSNANTWGDGLNTGAFDVIDYAMDGWQTLSITGNHTLSTPNGTTTSNEAGARVLKLTTATATYTQQLPALEGWYLVHNATSAAQVISSAGGGASVSVPAAAKVLVFTDAAAVYELGYSGLGLKDYIDAAIVTATGSLPAVTGNNGKYLACNGSTWLPTTFSASGSVVWAGTSTTSALTPGDVYSAFAEVTLTSSSNSVAVDMSAGINFVHTLTENTTIANPTNPKVGQTGWIRIVQHASSAKTCAVGSNWKRVGGALAVSTTLSATDILVYQVITSTFILYDILKAPS